MLIASETWRKASAHWGALAMAGLYTLTVGLLASVPFWVLWLPLGIIHRVGRALNGVDADLNLLMTAGWLIFVLFILAVVVALFISPIAMGGLVHGVMQIQRGRQASFAEMWHAGLRRWSPMFYLQMILVVVLIGLDVAGAVLHAIPLVGDAVWALGAGLVLVVLAGYGPLMVVADGLGAGEAVSRAFRMLTGNFVEVLLTLLVLAVGGAAYGLIARILEKLPLLGPLVLLLVNLFVWPLALLYLAIRYRTNIAPEGGPPAGSATWHPDPPPGP